MTDQQNERLATAKKPNLPPKSKAMNKISNTSKDVEPLEPVQETEPAPEPPRYQEPLQEFAGLRVPEGNSFKAKHRQRGVYVEHELDAILCQQQAMKGKGTVTNIVNAALREYFKKHRISYIERTDRGTQHTQK